MAKGNIEKNTGYVVKPGDVTTKQTSEGSTTVEEKSSAAQMRYQSNVGIKQRSPMKKGYFKNK